MADELSKVVVINDNTDYSLKDSLARQHMVKTDDEDQLIDGWKNFIKGFKIGGAESGKEIKFTAADAEGNDDHTDRIDFGELIIPAYTDIQTDSNDHNVEGIDALGATDTEEFTERINDAGTIWNFYGTLMLNDSPIASMNDIDPTKLVGRKYQNNANYGEIVGDYTNNIAIDPQSFVGGINNISQTNNAQTVFGKYNLNLQDDLFEIGNGINNNERSNAFRVTNNGTIYCSDAVVGGTSINTERTKSSVSYYVPDSYGGDISTQNQELNIINMQRQNPTQTTPLCICTIPIELNKDGNVTVTAFNNGSSNQLNYTQYFTEGKHNLVFTFLMAKNATSLTMNISTSYNGSSTSSATGHSKIRLIDGKLNAIENYINNLGSYTPTYDNTLPTVTIYNDKRPKLFFFGCGWGTLIDDQTVTGLTDLLTE